ncbi:hypothetical protein SteCoe_5236 [Stentor coeruleus]|uniref:Uncharacterized protein n=1 Tax=Stentor coeruleus TaxID=5963 RepID=A0A1R2CSQ0_9CILI|nr:hypothetical protein SteCoe_5236 [Stentor coeruleus]
MSHEIYLKSLELDRIYASQVNLSPSSMPISTILETIKELLMKINQDRLSLREEYFRLLLLLSKAQKPVIGTIKTHHTKKIFEKPKSNKNHKTLLCSSTQTLIYSIDQWTQTSKGHFLDSFEYSSSSGTVINTSYLRLSSDKTEKEFSIDPLSTVVISDESSAFFEAQKKTLNDGIRSSETLKRTYDEESTVGIVEEGSLGDLNIPVIITNISKFSM